MKVRSVMPFAGLYEHPNNQAVKPRQFRHLNHSQEVSLFGF